MIPDPSGVEQIFQGPKSLIFSFVFVNWYQITNNNIANTYSQIYIQLVFAVQNRKSLISPDWETELYKYITGIVTHKDQKLIAINGMPDHLHIFLGMKPDCLLSNLIQEI